MRCLHPASRRLTRARLQTYHQILVVQNAPGEAFSVFELFTSSLSEEPLRQALNVFNNRVRGQFGARAAQRSAPCVPMARPGR